MAQHCIVTHSSMLQGCGTLMTLCQWVQHVVSVWTHIFLIMPCQWPFCTVLTPGTCEYHHCLRPFLINLWMDPSSIGPGRSLRSSSLVPGYVVNCRELSDMLEMHLWYVMRGTGHHIHVYPYIGMCLPTSFPVPHILNNLISTINIIKSVNMITLWIMWAE
jgi:hypothetical protein